MSTLLGTFFDAFVPLFGCGCIRCLRVSSKFVDLPRDCRAQGILEEVLKQGPLKGTKPETHRVKHNRPRNYGRLNQRLPLLVCFDFRDQLFFSAPISARLL